MEEKVLVNVPGLDPSAEVVIRELGFGSVTRIRAKSVKRGAEDADVGEFQKWLVAYGVKQAPFFEGLPRVEDRAKALDNDCISIRTGDFLFKEIQQICGFIEIQDQKKE